MEQDTPTFDAWYSSKRTNFFGLIVSDRSKLNFMFTSPHITWENMWPINNIALAGNQSSRHNDMVIKAMIILLIPTLPALQITKMLDLS